MVMAAVLAGVGTVAAVALIGRTRYVAQTTVFVSRVVPPTNGDVDTSIADFETALRLRQVDDTVAGDTYVSAASVRSGIAVSRLASSSTVRVSFSSGSPSVASAVVVSAAHAALTTLAQQQLDAGIESVNAAQLTAGKALDSLSQLNQSVQADDVEADYARHSQNLITLQNQEAVSPSVGLVAEIASERAVVAKLAGAVPQYLQLKSASDSAQATLATANEVLTGASGLLNAARSPSVLTAPTTSRASRIGTMARLGGAAAAGVLVIVYALFVAADARKGGPRAAAPPAKRSDEVAAPLPTYSGSTDAVEVSANEPAPLATTSGAGGERATPEWLWRARAAADGRAADHDEGKNGVGEQAEADAGPVADRAPG
jgi:hypothetical protein